MNHQEFLEWVAIAISDRARSEGLMSFSLTQSFDDYLLSYRSILEHLNREVGPYTSEYDFNLKKAKFVPKKIT